MELAQGLEHQFKTQVLEVFGCTESGILACRQTATETFWQLSDLFELDVRKDGILIQGEHLPEEVVLQDVIRKVSDSQFEWLGRHRDMINIAGKRGSLTDLNRRLLAIAGVVDGVIFKPSDTNERLSALVVAPELGSTDILRELKSEVDPVFLPRPVYMVPSLPRQETGKLANKEVMKLFKNLARAKNPDQERE